MSSRITESRKSAALVFRGFEFAPSEVERLLGRQAARVGCAGDPVKPGVKTVLKRSFAFFSVDLPYDCRLDQVVPALLEKLGGIEKLESVYAAVSPEFFELDLVWPVKHSQEQEGGFIPASALALLVRLKCDLSFSFL